MPLGTEIGLGPGDFVLRGEPAPPLHKGGIAPPQFSAHFCCGKTAGCIKMPLGTEVGLSPGDFVLDGDPASPPHKGAALPIFGPCLFWANGWMDQDGTWHGGRPSLGDLVLDGDPAPLPKKGAEPPPQVSAHFYCGQTAGCIKMPLGMAVGLSPRNFVLDGYPPKRGAEHPIFGPCLLRPNSCMDQDATWYGGRPRPRRHCVRWGNSSLPKKGRSPPPNFRLTSIVAKRLDG